MFHICMLINQYFLGSSGEIAFTDAYVRLRDGINLTQTGLSSMIKQGILSNFSINQRPSDRNFSRNTVSKPKPLHLCIITLWYFLHLCLRPHCYRYMFQLHSNLILLAESSHIVQVMIMIFIYSAECTPHHSYFMKGVSCLKPLYYQDYRILIDDSPYEACECVLSGPI